MTAPARPTVSKVVSLAELLAALAPERARGRSVVFTNGCYDILHAGHLHLLETAAAQGDLLVVAVNRDGSVRRLKGEGRPFVEFAERARMLAALSIVDWVVGFDDDTPAAVIDAVVPDVLIKGGDWAVDRIVGRETVEAHGGRVLSIPMVEGRSTTSLVERIRGTRNGSGPAGRAS